MAGVKRRDSRLIVFYKGSGVHSLGTGTAREDEVWISPSRSYDSMDMDTRARKHRGGEGGLQGRMREVAW